MKNNIFIAVEAGFIGSLSKNFSYKGKAEEPYKIDSFTKWKNINLLKNIMKKCTIKLF